MKKKCKCFLKCNAKATIWFAYYLVVQSLVCLGLFFVLLFDNDEFCERFIDYYEPVSRISDYWKRQLACYDALQGLLQGYSGVLIGLSSVIILVILAVIWIIRKKQITWRISVTHMTWCYVAGCFINLMLTAIVASLPECLVHTHDAATEFALSDTFLLNLIAVGILGPIVEEIIFRYGIQHNLYPVNITYAILYSGCIFGLLHGNQVQIVYATLLGWLFGYIYYRTGSLMYTIFLHIGINSSSVIVNELFNNEVIGLMYMCIIVFLLKILINRIRYIKIC